MAPARTSAESLRLAATSSAGLEELAMFGPPRRVNIIQRRHADQTRLLQDLGGSVAEVFSTGQTSNVRRTKWSPIPNWTLGSGNSMRSTARQNLQDEPLPMETDQVHQNHERHVDVQVEGSPEFVGSDEKIPETQQQPPDAREPTLLASQERLQPDAHNMPRPHSAARRST